MTRRWMLIASLVATLAASSALAQVALRGADQEISGTTLTLDTVTLEQDGFVVVHATDADGLVLTPPLGLTYLEAGTYQNVDVELDPEELAKYAYHRGGTVVPMLHVDANQDGEYQFPDGGDVPVTQDGAAVVIELDLTLAPSLTTFDQTAQGGALTVDTVVAAQDGFVVVHALDMDGEAVLTPPLGFAQVDAGITRYQRIELDAELLAEYGYDDATKAVVPMLHVDADGDGNYEFPEGPDVPVTADGGPLVAPLALSMPEAGAASVDVGEGRMGLDGDGAFVRLPSVTLTQPGFVVLHAQNEDGGVQVLPIVGASDALPAGTSEDVRVWIDADRAPVVGDTLYAMVHVDDGDGAYRFPESDPPYVQDGGPLVEAFTLN